MKTTLTLLTTLVVLTLSSCYKENKIAGQLEGNWTITEMLWAKGNSVITSGDTHIISFSPCEKAYTATCSGNYTLNYAADTIQDINVTFKFDLKDDEIVFHTINNVTIRNFLSQRFTLEDYKSGNLSLKRIDFRTDSTQAIIKAVKQ